jgi:hypothetical protein
MIAILCLPLLLLFLMRIGHFAFPQRAQTGDVSVRYPRIEKYLRLSGIVILIGGALGAGCVYMTTQPGPGDDDDIVSYDVVGGQVFPVKASESLSYHQHLESTGGNYDVLADEVFRWVGRRWHGRNLATTLVVLSGGAFLACFYLARWF